MSGMKPHELKFGDLVASKSKAYDDRKYHFLCSFGKCRTHKTDRGCENSDGNCDIDTAHLLFSPGDLYDDFGYSQLEVLDEDLIRDWESVPPITQVK